MKKTPIPEPKQPDLFPMHEESPADKPRLVYREDLVAYARQRAKELAQAHPQRLCDMDTVNKSLTKEGYTPEQIGNCAGSTFPRSQWERVGDKATGRASSHGRRITVWRLK